MRMMYGIFDSYAGFIYIYSWELDDMLLYKRAGNERDDLYKWCFDATQD